jgi:hypothetical protein
MSLAHDKAKQNAFEQKTGSDAIAETFSGTFRGKFFDPHENYRKASGSTMREMLNSL